MAIYEVEKDSSGTPTGTKLVAGGTLYADSPIGTILPYGGASAPSGWFLCQGQALSRTTYSELFGVIGTSFGAGNGSTTFNLPDMRESVPKGAGLTGHTVGAHLDADGLAVGEFLDDRIEDHNHQMDYSGDSTVGIGSYASLVQTQNISSSKANTSYVKNARFGGTTEVKSVGVNYIIKAKMVAVPADFLAKVDEAINENATSPVSASNKLITQSDNGCLTFTIAPNKTATITVGATYLSLFVSIQIQGAGSRALCLEYNNTSIYGKLIRDGSEYNAERGQSTFTILNTLTFANSASRQLTIANSGSETETITIMGNVVNVTVS